MRANLLLESLKAAAAAIPGDSGSPEARTVLLRVMAATQDRRLFVGCIRILINPSFDKHRESWRKEAPEADSFLYGLRKRAPPSFRPPCTLLPVSLWCASNALRQCIIRAPSACNLLNRV